MRAGQMDAAGITATGLGIIVRPVLVLSSPGLIETYDQLDRVRGAAHFEVPVARGRRLMKILRESLPGYAVPTYVVEEAGKTSKTPVSDLIL